MLGAWSTASDTGMASTPLPQQLACAGLQYMEHCAVAQQGIEVIVQPSKIAAILPDVRWPDFAGPQQYVGSATGASKQAPA
jgi:hypothetical protein